MSVSRIEQREFEISNKADLRLNRKIKGEEEREGHFQHDHDVNTPPPFTVSPDGHLPSGSETARIGGWY
jgi:hypothetical protein